MHITKFYIENYRAITDRIEISIDKESLIPIIGVNECGKTTILNAIFAFDYSNDSLNENGKHLKDVKNLYNTNSFDPLIGASITISEEEIKNFLKLASEQYEASEKERISKLSADQQSDG
ncbi:AAA family ATPase [Leptospira kmetyi]|uniref:AAA family ATPase n=1 Tax=Leptospira kmetyi TaxID=408139 RepID=UPI003EBBB934